MKYRVQIALAAWVIVRIAVVLVRFRPCKRTIARPNCSTECKKENSLGQQKEDIRMYVYRERKVDNWTHI